MRAPCPLRARAPRIFIMEGRHKICSISKHGGNTIPARGNASSSLLITFHQRCAPFGGGVLIAIQPEHERARRRRALLLSSYEYFLSMSGGGMTGARRWRENYLSAAGIWGCGQPAPPSANAETVAVKAKARRRQHR